jgi:prepilin-type N-terminal cleavage/methylation domain-containing protein
MGIFGKKTNTSGFTVIELLVAITVIGILATIVIVSYGGYQARTRDNVRKSDVSQIAGALSAYLLQKDTYIEAGSGCGLSGNGNGWLNAGPSDTGAGSYPRAITACLQDAKTLGTGAFVDPSNCIYGSGGKCGTLGSAPVQAYMKITCTKSSNKITYVMAHLEASPQNNSALDALCDANSATGFTSDQRWGTTYGMNYYVVAK